MSQSIADYVCLRTECAASSCGRLPEDAWRRTEKTQRFVDLVTGEPGLYDTRAAALWNDQALFVRFDVEEPSVKARYSKRDTLVFTENSVEILIDGGDCYYELAVNALATVYEVFYIWKDALCRGGRFDTPEFDVLQRDALTFCGDSDRDPATFWRGTHKRGCRWAFLDWDLSGLKVHTSINGLINDPTHVDCGWMVEIMIPWSGIRPLAGNRPLPPSPCDEWRIFFGRNEMLSIGGKIVEPNPIWALRPHGIRDTHRPESFPRVKFAGDQQDNPLDCDASRTDKSSS